MQYIDMESWPRREVYDYMSRSEKPHYAVTFTQDVTKLYDYTKSHGLSFYHALTYFVTKALNCAENFRYDTVNGAVVLYDERIPSLAELNKATEQLFYVNCPVRGTVEEYCAALGTLCEKQESLFGEEDTRDLVFISCLPWLELTGLTNANLTDPDDCIPRITWGKWRDEGGRKTLGICLEVNHRFIDGIHIGKFAQELTKLIEEL